MQIRKKPKILLFSFDLDERKELSDKIRSIGGILYESSVSEMNFALVIALLENWRQFVELFLTLY